jgi:NAD(P)-dependent dehydrogenase (short-subunit alcohol dehydrogenase family)
VPVKPKLLSPWQGLAFVGGAIYGFWSRPQGLAGKVVLITGGARGLGLAMARQYARRGARLVLCSRTQSQLDRAQAELEKIGTQVLTVRCDVGDEEEVRELRRRALDRFGRIDVLVNNAGIIQVGPFETMELDDFALAMDSIFWGSLNMTTAFLPYLGRGARIVNITSMGGAVAIPHMLPYAAAKFAARGLSEGLRTELAHRKIRVTTVIPGLMRTGSFVNALFKGKREREMDWFALAASMPVLTVGADRAAAMIVSASLRGKAVLTIGWPAKAGRLAHGLFPGLTAGALSLINRFLPDAPVVATHAPAEQGGHHRDRLTRSRLTALGERAARRFNESA